jgi:hypothetical protein
MTKATPLELGDPPTTTARTSRRSIPAAEVWQAPPGWHLGGEPAYAPVLLGLHAVFESSPGRG